MDLIRHEDISPISDHHIVLCVINAPFIAIGPIRSDLKRGFHRFRCLFGLGRKPTP